tara:strand:- start:293 stop:466 length:174 start_codon:yes stop_codon:yes gene_type:complete
MKLLILLSGLVYIFYRLGKFFINIFSFSKHVNDNYEKSDFSKKINSLDIQDAEYEDK